jgi:hypothetical protein
MGAKPASQRVMDQIITARLPLGITVTTRTAHPCPPGLHFHHEVRCNRRADDAQLMRLRQHASRPASRRLSVGVAVTVRISPRCRRSLHFHARCDSDQASFSGSGDTIVPVPQNRWHCARIGINSKSEEPDTASISLGRSPQRLGRAMGALPVHRNGLTWSGRCAGRCLKVH